MRVLRGTEVINRAIPTCPDRSMAEVLVSHLRFLSTEGDVLLIVVIVEPCDTLGALDGQLEHKLLIDPWGDQSYGDPGFKPCFETLEEYPSFYEMVFIEGDEVGIGVLVPKAPGVDAELLALCAQHATPAQELSS